MFASEKGIILESNGLGVLKKMEDVEPMLV